MWWNEGVLAKIKAAERCCLDLETKKKGVTLVNTECEQAVDEDRSGVFGEGRAQMVNVAHK